MIVPERVRSIEAPEIQTLPHRLSLQAQQASEAVPDVEGEGRCEFSPGEEPAGGRSPERVSWMAPAGCDAQRVADFTGLPSLCSTVAVRWYAPLRRLVKRGLARRSGNEWGIGCHVWRDRHVGTADRMVVQGSDARAVPHGRRPRTMPPGTFSGVHTGVTTGLVRVLACQR